MTNGSPLTHLEESLTKQIDGFDESRRFYRSAHFYITLATAVLSASTTVLIGAGQTYPSKFLSVLSLACSAAITVVAAYEGFLRSRDLWVQKTDTWMALQNLDAEIKYTKAKAGGADLDQALVDRFYERFNAIIMGEHESWKMLRSAANDRATPPSRK